VGDKVFQTAKFKQAEEVFAHQAGRWQRGARLAHVLGRAAR